MKQILADIGRFQCRIALVENGVLTELLSERNRNRSMVGNIYCGEVDSVLPGIGAAFVDIGDGKKAYLNMAEDALVLREGQKIVIQIEKDATDAKGPKASTKLNLPGRYMALVPERSFVSVSKRITDSEERERLRQIGETVCPAGMGMIIRTNAEGCGVKELERDCRLLMAIWDGIQGQWKTAEKRTLLYRNVGLVTGVIRDLLDENTTAFFINDSTAFAYAVQIAKLILPELADRICLYERKTPIFSYYGLEEAVAQITERRIPLGSGGWLSIDRTEAMTCVDVNSGNLVSTGGLEDTALRTNTEAARELARQLRLRDLGGMVVVDFINMASEESRRSVLEVFKNCCRTDRSKVTIYGFTRLGLVELTRKRIQKRTEEVLKDNCTFCGGTGRVPSAESVCEQMVRDLRALFVRGDVSAVLIKANDQVTECFLGKGGETLKAMEQAMERKIRIVGERARRREDYQIVPLTRKEWMERME